ncbi:MAG: hypothetical protein V1886_01445 [archaeon]
MIKSNSNNLCIVCNEGIHNPICPVCLAGEIKEWIETNNLSSEAKKKIVSYASRIKNKFIDSGTECTICRENQTAVCPYCFTEEMYNFLMKLNLQKDAVESFLTSFNYDSEHAGYSKEFEEDFGN